MVITFKTRYRVVNKLCKNDVILQKLASLTNGHWCLLNDKFCFAICSKRSIRSNGPNLNNVTIEKGGHGGYAKSAIELVDYEQSYYIDDCKNTQFVLFVQAKELDQELKSALKKVGVEVYFNTDELVKLISDIVLHGVNAR